MVHISEDPTIGAEYSSYSAQLIVEIVGHIAVAVGLLAQPTIAIAIGVGGQVLTAHRGCQHIAEAVEGKAIGQGLAVVRPPDGRRVAAWQQ